jgi:hypothetical protein
MSTNILGLKSEISTHKFGSRYPNPKVFWVDNPEAHPIVSTFLDGLMEPAEPEQEEEEEEEEDQARDSTPIDTLRAQAHGCFSCAHQPVCAIGSHPLMDLHKIIVSACQAHLAVDKD